jgi:DNA-directed RNA polymerase specialized sigma24 family protein
MVDLDEHLPLIRSGDTGAFARWLAGAEPTMRDSVRSFAAVIDVEAVLQEALLRTWQIAPRLEADGKANGLLRVGIRIARNLAVSERRRARDVAADDDALDRALADDPSREPAPAHPDPALRRVIAECAAALPEQPARALHARLESAGAAPDEELAERIGMRKNTFLQNFGRARKLLAECLRRRGIDLSLELA